MEIVTKESVARKLFAKNVCQGLNCDHLEEMISAFETVKRETFLPGPPWKIQHGKVGRIARVLETENICDVYQDALIVIDPERRLNNGLPSLWAYLFAFAGKPEEFSRILHLGCATGYYTAVMSRIFHEAIVHYHDIDSDLMDSAKGNLAGFEHTKPGADGTFDLIMYSFGIHRLQFSILDKMNENCVVIAPVVTADGSGRIARIEKHGSQIQLKYGPICYFYLDQSGERPPKKLDFNEGVFDLPLSGDFLFV